MLGKATIRTKVPIKIKDNVQVDFVTFNFNEDTGEHIAILFKGYDKIKAPLVRIHSECLTGDVFGSHRCDCGFQLNEAIELMSGVGGVILYLRQEGRGIGLYNKIDAYKLQIEENMDTFEANNELGFPDDARNFNVAAEMLNALKINKIKLLSNNPDKKNQLEASGIDIVSVMSTGIDLTNDNKGYLEAKVNKGHKISGI